MAVGSAKLDESRFLFVSSVLGVAVGVGIIGLSLVSLLRPLFSVFVPAGCSVAFGVGVLV